MPKYKVLRPIEHNLKLYLPEGTENPPEKKPSSGHGLDIPVDASGVIDLTEADAAPMTHGQIEPVKTRLKGKG
jgi:hypothetical protein